MSLSAAKSQLTQRQREILDFIIAELKSRGSSPSIIEISEFIGAKSTSTVHHHLAALEKKGFLVREAGKSRSVKPAGWDYKESVSDDMIELPVIGEIAAGQPIYAYENYNETLKVARSLLASNEGFILRVCGKSMVEDLIDDGDMVIVRKQDHAADGDIVVALLEDEKATLKRIYRESNRIRLQPANCEMQPIYTHEVRILGRVISVIRPMERKAKFFD